MTTATSIMVRVPLAIRHQPGRKTVVTPITDGVAPVATRADPALVKALARAFRYQRMLDKGRYASVTEMAAAERLERGYLGSLLRLTLLAPNIVKEILDGRQPGGMTLSGLMKPFAVGWVDQNKASYFDAVGALVRSAPKQSFTEFGRRSKGRQATGMPGPLAVCLDPLYQPFEEALTVGILPKHAQAKDAALALGASIKIPMASGITLDFPGEDSQLRVEQSTGRGNTLRTSV